MSRSFGLAVLAIVLRFADQAAASSTVDELIALHENALALVHRLEGTVEVDQDLDGSVEVRVQHWRDGERVREKNWSKPPVGAPGYPDDGRFRGTIDAFHDVTSYRRLRNWNDDDPPTLDPFNQEAVRAEMGPRNLLGSCGVAYMDTHLMRALHMPGGPFTLADLKDQGWSLRVGPPGDFDGRPTVVIIATSPKTLPDRQPIVQTAEIELDPALNYMIVAFRHHTRTQAFKNYPGMQTESRQRVAETRDFGGGIYLPTETLMEARSANDPSDGALEKAPWSRVRRRFSNINVNEPIDEEVFHLEFPDNVWVIEEPTVDGKNKAHLWRDGAPVATFDNYQDRLAYIENWLRSQPITTRPWWPWALGGAALLMAFLVAAARRRRRLRGDA